MQRDNRIDSKTSGVIDRLTRRAILDCYRKPAEFSTVWAYNPVLDVFSWVSFWLLLVVLRENDLLRT